MLKPTDIRLYDQVKVVQDRSCLQGEVVLISPKGVQIRGFRQDKPNKTTFVKWCNVLDKAPFHFDKSKSEIAFSFISDTFFLERGIPAELIENIKNGTSLEGEAYRILTETFEKNLKNTSEIEGMI